MKKLSNNNGVIKSSTLAGQRELLREYRNKINEMIEEYDARFQTHEDRINSIAEDKGENMKQTPIPEKIEIPSGLIDPWKIYYNSLINVLTKQQKEIERDNKYFTRLFEELTECIQLIQTQVDEQPYTAMRSTGEVCVCEAPLGSVNPERLGCIRCNKPIKPQEYCECPKYTWAIECKKCGKPQVPIKLQEDVRIKSGCGCTCHHEGKDRCSTCSYNHMKPQEYCTCNKVIGKIKDGNIYETCMCGKPIKQQEDNYILKQKIIDLLLFPATTMGSVYKTADRILAIVKGE